MPENIDHVPTSRAAGKFRAAKDLSIKTCEGPAVPPAAVEESAKVPEDFYSALPALPNLRTKVEASAPRSYRQTAQDEAAKR